MRGKEGWELIQYDTLKGTETQEFEMAIQKWEYRRAQPSKEFIGARLDLTRDELHEAWLNMMGEEGWELIQFDGMGGICDVWYLFKRPKQ